MRIWKMVLVSVLLFVLMSCRHKTGNGDGTTQKIEPEDFQAMFRNLSLPVNFGDSSLSKKASDSSMSWQIFTQFVSDSVIHKHFDKSVKPKLYASGKIVVKNSETYLFIKAISLTRKILYVICLDKDGKFQTGMPIIIRDDDLDVRYTASIDNKYAISISRIYKDGDGKSYFVRAVYVYNAEGIFTLIMRESNEGRPRTDAVHNPIDTLPHKHKFAGDYIQDKRNFISFRDGRNSSILRFFIHFEKDNGSCKGELRGEARFVSSTAARYLANGDPCSLEFIFSDKNVRMKELEGCGSHRDIKCYFDGVYLKHKELNTKTVKPKRH